MGDISSSFSGGTPKVSKVEYYGGEIPFIRSAELNSQVTELHLTKKGLENSSAKMVSQGDLLYALYGATSGEVGISRLHGAINQAILALRPKGDYSTYFIFYWLRLNKSDIISKYLQGGQGNLSASIIKKLNIDLPCIGEQTSIGNFFRTLDNLIALQQRKLEALQKLKQGYLQQMFPQEGETVPRVRFAGFDELWEVYKLGDIVEKLKSYPLFRDAETDDITGYRHIHYGDIHKQVADIVERDDQLPNIIAGNYTPIEKGDLVLADASEDSAGIAEPSVILHQPETKIIAGLHTIAIRPISTDSLFLYYLFHTGSFRKFGARVGTGAKVTGVTYSNLAQYEMSLPCLGEQSIIGSFIYELDQQIVAQIFKIEQIQHLKRGYLQKMFV